MPDYPLPPPAFGDPEPHTPPVGRARSTARQLESNPLDYRTDAKGRVVAGHPVDQGMGLSMSIRKGAIRSATNVGNDLHKVQVGTDRTAQEVRAAVLNAYPLSRYVENREVEILRILHEERDSGGIMVLCEYRNLLTNKSDKAFYRENQP